MNLNEKSADNGGVIISNEVIASIASSAVRDVDGFGSFANRTPDFLSQAVHGGDMPKSIKVWSLDNDVKIQMFINIKSGVNIQSVCTAMQRSVKNAVQSMTGKVVSKVNICIQGVEFCEPTELKA